MATKRWWALGCLVLVVAASALTVVQLQMRDFQPICGGAIQEKSLRYAIGDGGIKASEIDELDSELPFGRLSECEASAEDDSTSLTVAVGNLKSASLMSELSGHRDLTGLSGTSAPLGDEWPGVLTVKNKDIAYTTVVLKCGRSASHQGILVNVKQMLVEGEGNFSNDQQKRLKLAQSGAAVASDVSEKWKCGAKLGGEIDRAPDDVAVNKPLPLSQATGTCRAMRPLAATATKWGIAGAASTRADRRAPAQDCVLLNSKGDRVYRLSALYGPLEVGFRKSSRSLYRVSGEAGQRENNPGWAWASAKCPDGPAAALFTASSLEHSSEGEPVILSAEFERRMLGAFAEHLADQHGCRLPTLPGD
ncbi:hypothetical protein [Streptomyces sp. NPDC006784]|uniref:hypothetical protein n=1 Tax=Streptomyces sp. NPDC006784 TaxID=3364764 RepID=UPI0036AE81C0